MRLLIVGADGMLGHQLASALASSHEVWGTVRRDRPAWVAAGGRLPPDRVDFGVDVRRPDALVEALARRRPEAVINAAGVVKQRPEAQDALVSLEVNAVFPHRLALLCQAAGARLLHVSTDCVFSGKQGGYRESDVPDAADLYGLTKLLGELRQGQCLTLRTSIIGLEQGQGRRQGLIEWFLASRGPVKGYRRAIFSGLTTLELARLMDRLLTRHPDLSGLWHVAAQPIDKHTLLSLLARELGRKDVTIEPDDTLVCDRSLRAEAFNEATGYRPPVWPEMIRELAEQVRQREAR